ncbi:MAG: protease modulator HflC [Gammaproteobacteria bacterium RIFCSPLOWO2_02_FULL_56_15]|nr:MAG: protease modulator HflC [Gammaproteobacteria bacterium RIFCSPLOWO2_02_FULL_56_15]
MNNKLIISVILILVGLFASFSLFQIQQWERAIIFEFGEIKRSDYVPGLHFKLPWVNTVKKFETRLLNLEQQPQRFLTSEKKDVIVDYYAKWRISDVEQFYRATNGGDISYANTLLAQRINSAIRDEFGRRTVQEVVAGDRTEVLSLVRNNTARLPTEMGIAMVDVRIKKINLPDEVSSSVYSRMRAERTRVAKDFRARGSEAAERIQANADREREVILANAYRDSEMIRGEGDAGATEIYAASFGKNEEFYGLYRSLNAYQQSFKNGNDIMLLQPDSDFFKYFKDPDGKR